MPKPKKVNEGNDAEKDLPKVGPETVIPQEGKEKSGYVHPIAQVKDELPPFNPDERLEDPKPIPAQEEAMARSVENKRYYGNYPRIISEQCEFCGVPYKHCMHYKKAYEEKGEFICLCGASSNAGKRQYISLLYMPHRGFFICDTEGCKQAYKGLHGGFEKTAYWHFLRREIPFAGDGMLLPEPGGFTKL